MTPKPVNGPPSGSSGYVAPPFSSLRTASASPRLSTNRPSSAGLRPYGVSSSFASSLGPLSVAYVYSKPVSADSFASDCCATTRRTVPDRERITIESVSAPPGE